MKKLIFFLSLMICFVGISQAQTYVYPYPVPAGFGNGPTALQIHDGLVGVIKQDTAVVHTDSTNAKAQLILTTQFSQVISSSSAYIVNLPSISSTAVGMTIRGFVGANGFNLRLSNADQKATTVYLNNTTANHQAAIPANSLFVIDCVSPTQWIVTAKSYAGAAVATITPGTF